MSTLPANRNPTDRNAEATVHIAQLDEKVTDALLWELMVQAGPVRHVYIPRNRITGSHFGYGFCEYRTPLDAIYATKVLNMTPLFSKPLRISQSTVDRGTIDVGANLFVGNLVDEVDEKLLHDAFSAFGALIEPPVIIRDAPAPSARRYGFVKYGRFDHADAAIAALNGQYICNHPIAVEFAFKKDSGNKERHGSEAERTLAARALQNASSAPSIADQLQPNTLFADQPAKRPRLPPPQAYPPTPFAPPQAVNPHAVPPTHNVPYPYVPIHTPPIANPTAVPTAQPPPYATAHPNAPAAPYGAPVVPLPVVPAWQHGAAPVANGAHPNMRAPPFPHRHPEQPPPVYPPFGQLAPHTVDIGWSRGRRFGSRQPPPPGSHYPPNAPSFPSDAARPVADEEAPPPPTTN